MAIRRDGWSVVCCKGIDLVDGVVVDGAEDEAEEEVEVEVKDSEEARKAGILVEDGYQSFTIYHQQSLGCTVWISEMHGTSY
jgi:hypothetical protein